MDELMFEAASTAAGGMVETATAPGRDVDGAATRAEAADASWTAEPATAAQDAGGVLAVAEGFGSLEGGETK